jgi:hypothetical protein
MSLDKIHYQNHFVFDKFGDQSAPHVLILEDIFSVKKGNLNNLGNILGKKYYVTHVKSLFADQIDSLENNFLQNSWELLENFILERPDNSILISEGSSFTFALHLSLNLPTKIHSLYLLDPFLPLEKKERSYSTVFHFWKWFESQDNWFFRIYKIPFILDFYYRYEKYLSVLIQQELKIDTHFIIDEIFPMDSILELKKIHKKPEVFRLDNLSTEKMLSQKKIQKLLVWLLDKDYSTIMKNKY